ncbi:hypothetical protein Nepgr_014480 [Nepenthes gracilis]|uniref:Uncharacterized protein n=1 Tax=Nepenthes gracilis TaxID=150966 RepID=A0AAD3SKW8_NEPGR|nr:hypothetical protein Nepgr_014480 [Nepenthes gracilis]
MRNSEARVTPAASDAKFGCEGCGHGLRCETPHDQPWRSGSADLASVASDAKFRCETPHDQPWRSNSTDLGSTASDAKFRGKGYACGLRCEARLCATED